MNDDTLDEVRIERTFDATVGVVWGMGTVPEHYQRWYGPFGASIRWPRWMSAWAVPGGSAWRSTRPTAGAGCGSPASTARSRRTGSSSTPSPSSTRPESRCPSLTATNAETEVQIELEDLGGTTRVVLTHRGIPADSPGATGWSMALDALADALAPSPS